MIDESWVTEAGVIKKEIFTFYRKKFQDKWPSRPKIISPKFQSLDNYTSTSLEVPFSMEEIKHVVWECGNEKASGPDEFTFNFMKRY